MFKYVSLVVFAIAVLLALFTGQGDARDGGVIASRCTAVRNVGETCSRSGCLNMPEEDFEDMADLLGEENYQGNESWVTLPGTYMLCEPIVDVEDPGFGSEEICTMDEDGEQQCAEVAVHDGFDCEGAIFYWTPVVVFSCEDVMFTGTPVGVPGL